MGRSSSSIATRYRNEWEEKFVVDCPGPHLGCHVLVVEHDDELRIIAGSLPGMSGYHDNYPDVEDDHSRRSQRELAEANVEYALAVLDEYDPNTSSSRSNSGNYSMSDLYVTVDPDDRDDVLLKMWHIFNRLGQRDLEFRAKHYPEGLAGQMKRNSGWEPASHPSLKEEAARITARSVATLSTVEVDEE
jgi:hypothetical protein